MPHPLASLPPGRGRRLFLPLLALTILVALAMNSAAAPPGNAVAPQGIVSYELAGSPAIAGAILASWDQNARVRAGFGLGLDYVFMLLYSTTIGLGCLWAGGVLRGSLARIGEPLAWGQWLAALLDGVENVALLVMLLALPAAPASPWPEIARWCAAVKFALILLGLAYAAVGATGWLVRPRRA